MKNVKNMIFKSVFMAAIVGLLVFAFGSLASAQTLSRELPSQQIAEIAKMRRKVAERRASLHVELVKEDPRYQISLDLCKGKSGWVYWESYKETFDLALTPVEFIHRGLDNGFIAPVIKDLLDSEQFEVAMRECGSGAYERVIDDMFRADRSGKFLALATIYGGVRGGLRGHQVLKGASARYAAISGPVLTTTVVGWLMYNSYQLVTTLFNRQENVDQIKTNVIDRKAELRGYIREEDEKLVQLLRSEMQPLQHIIESENLPEAQRVTAANRVREIQALIAIREGR